MLEFVQRRRVRLPGSDLEIALLDWGGEGPLVLLHHANGFCAGVWAPVAESLRGRFRVVAMDARGHAASSSPRGAAAYAWDLLAEDLMAVAESLAAETRDARVAIGIGHSFGGTLMLAAAARRPRLFERVLLVDPVIFPPELATGPAREEHRRSLSDRARKRRHDWPTRGDARAWFVERELFAGWDPRALDAYVAEGLRSRPDGRVELCCRGEVEAAIFENGPTLDPFALAPEVPIPVRILRAARGDFPRQAFEALAARLPAASIHDVDAGHLVPMERPGLVAEAAISFAEAGR